MNTVNLDTLLNYTSEIKKLVSSYAFGKDQDNSEDTINTEILKNFIENTVPSLNKLLTANQKIIRIPEVFEILNGTLESIKHEINIVINYKKNIKNKDELIISNLKNINYIFRDLTIIKSLYNQSEIIEENITKKINKKQEDELHLIREVFKKLREEQDKSFLADRNTYYEENKKINISFNSSFEKHDSKFNELTKVTTDRFDQIFTKIQKDWKKIQQIQTENVYLNSYQKNKLRFEDNERKFIRTIYISFFISLLLIFLLIFKFLEINVFITLKIMVIVLFGVLIAYYLKLSTHYRLLADQAEQTHLELLAFPQYVAELEATKANDLKEQLALKYFGKEIDPKKYQDLNNTTQEQIKVSTELMKVVSSISNANKINVRNQNNNQDIDGRK